LRSPTRPPPYLVVDASCGDGELFRIASRLVIALDRFGCIRTIIDVRTRKAQGGADETNVSSFCPSGAPKK
jgi:hypothetical protein